MISPSLLASIESIDATAKVSELGMSDWTDSDSKKENDDDFQPPNKRLKLPTSSKKKRHFTEMVSSEELESILKGLKGLKRTRSGQFPVLSS